MKLILAVLATLVRITSLTTLTDPRRCGKLDLVFIVDSSGSICDDDPTKYTTPGGSKSCDNWNSVLKFIRDIVLNSWLMGRHYTHVAMVTFGNRGVLQWDLNEYMHADELEQAILTLRYQSQNTNTSGGLAVARTEVFTSQGGDRPDADNVAIVITDGKSTYDSELTIPNAEKLRNESDAFVLSVGITQNIDENEVRLLSSPPHERNSNYFRRATFADLTPILDTLVNRTCAPSECGSKIDLLFILDASDDMDVDMGGYDMDVDMGGYFKWDAVIRFAQLVIEACGVLGDGGANIGFIVYAWDAEVVIEMGKETNLEALLDTVGHLQLRGGSKANLTDALKLARDVVFTKTGGDRKDVVDLILLIAGAKSESNAGKEASDLKNKGVAIYVVHTATDTSASTLMTLSSSRKRSNFEYYYWARSLTFDSLKSIVRLVLPSIADYACDAGPGTDAGREGLNTCDLGIVVLVDESAGNTNSSIPDTAYDNWELIKHFLVDFVQHLSQLGNGTFRLGVVLFVNSDISNTSVRIYVDDDLGNPHGLVETIRNISNDKSWSNTSDAVALSILDALTEQHGNRVNSLNVVVALTTGKPDVDNDTLSEEGAARAASEGVETLNKNVDAANEPTGQESLLIKAQIITPTDDIFNANTVAGLRTKPWEPSLINQRGSSLASRIQDLMGDTCGQKGRSCKVDVVFVLDCSTSIGQKQYHKVRDFVASVVQELDLAEATRVGVLLFADNERLGFQLDAHGNSDEASLAVLDMEYAGGATSTASALDYMRKEMFTAASGDRADAPNVAVVITDGGSNMPNKQNAMDAVRRTKAAGIHVIAIGIGGWLDVYELHALGSYPRDVNVMVVGNASYLSEKKEALRKLVCNEVNECEGKPCKNGGSCDDGVGTYFCRCPAGFGGRNCTAACRAVADVSFALDSSGSVGPQNFQREVDLATEVIMSLGIHGNQCRVATQQFSDSSIVRSDLKHSETTEGVIRGLGFYYTAGTTNTADTLQEMRNHVFTGRGANRGGRDNVGVIVTGGGCDNPLDTWQQAMRSRADGIDLVAVAIGDDLHPHEMEAIATAGNAIYARDFDSMNDVAQTLVDAICNNIDECDPNPCLNRGTCLDLRNGFHCACAPDYTGNTCERGCSGAIDLVFIFDASKTIRGRRFKKVIEFAVDIVKQLEFGDKKTRVGAIKYSNNAEVQFHLDSYSSRQDVVAALRRVTYMRHGTYTAEALKKLVYGMFQPEKGHRREARKVAVLISNANSNIEKEQTIPRAIEAKNAGIHIVAVGIGNDVDVLELSGLASRPLSNNLFLAQTQDDLPGLAENVLAAFCNDKDDCQGGPCAEGNCTDGFGEYNCDCRDDFTGQNCDRRCTAAMDLVLLFDLSVDVNLVHVVTTFAERILYGVNMALHRTHVGMIAFSDTSKTWLRLGTDTDKRSVLNALAFPRTRGRSNTQSALTHLRTHFRTSRAGDRPGIDNKAVLITGAQSNFHGDCTQLMAEKCREDGIELFVAVVGENPDVSEVNGIASDPDFDHVYRIGRPGTAYTEAERLLDFLCQ